MSEFPSAYPPEDVKRSLNKKPKFPLKSTVALGLGLSAGSLLFGEKGGEQSAKIEKSQVTRPEPIERKEGSVPVREIATKIKRRKETSQIVNKGIDEQKDQIVDDEMNPDSPMYKEKIHEMEEDLFNFLEENFPRFYFFRSSKDRVFEKNHELRVGPHYMIEASPVDFMQDTSQMSKIEKMDSYYITVEIDPISEVYIFTSTVLPGMQVTAATMGEVRTHFQAATEWVEQVVRSSGISPE